MLIPNQARKDYDQTHDYLWVRQTEQNNRYYPILPGLTESHTKDSGTDEGGSNIHVHFGTFLLAFFLAGFSPGAVSINAWTIFLYSTWPTRL